MNKKRQISNKAKIITAGLMATCISELNSVHSAYGQPSETSFSSMKDHIAKSIGLKNGDIEKLALNHPNSDPAGKKEKKIAPEKVKMDALSETLLDRKNKITVRHEAFKEICELVAELPSSDQVDYPNEFKNRFEFFEKAFEVVTNSFNTILRYQSNEDLVNIFEDNFPDKFKDFHLNFNSLITIKNRKKPKEKGGLEQLIFL